MADTITNMLCMTGDVEEGHTIATHTINKITARMTEVDKYVDENNFNKVNILKATFRDNMPKWNLDTSTGYTLLKGLMNIKGSWPDTMISQTEAIHPQAKQNLEEENSNNTTIHTTNDDTPHAHTRQTILESKKIQISQPSPERLRVLITNLRSTDVATISEKQREGDNAPLKHCGLEHLFTHDILPLVSKAHITIILMLGMTMGISTATEMQHTGDTTAINNITFRLHQLTDGNHIISATVIRPQTHYQQEWHEHDFTEAAEAEQHMITLRNEIEQYQDVNIQPKPVDNKKAITIKNQCDCHLTTPPKDNSTWVADHTEQHTTACNEASTEDAYEVTTTTGKDGTTCTINPTPKTRTTIYKTYAGMNTKEIANEINKQSKTRCITQGGYDINGLPQNEITKITAQDMIECQAACRIDHKCTTWMYITTNNQCWTLQIQNHHYTYKKSNNSNVLTGTRTCIPCKLDRDIHISTRDNTKTQTHNCNINWKGRPTKDILCPCKERGTYKNALKQIKTINMKAASNSIVYNNNTNNKNRRQDKLKNLLLTLKEQPTTNNLLDTILKGGHKTFASIMTTLANGDPNQTKHKTMTPNIINTITQMLGANIGTRISINQEKQIKTTNNQLQHGLRAIHHGATTIFKPENTIPTISTGQPTTNENTTRDLTEIDDFITNSNIQKEYIFNRLATPQTNEDPFGKNTLDIMMDTGDKITEITISSIEDKATIIEITAMPTPTWTTENQLKTTAITGTTQIYLEALKNVQPRQIQCALQMAEGHALVTKCETSETPEQIPTTTTVLVQTQSTNYRLIRICEQNTAKQSILVNCGDNPRFIRTKGIAIVLIGPTCQITNTQGQPIATELPHRPGTKNEFYMLYNQAITNRHTTEQTTNIVQNTLLAIIIIAITLLTVIETKRCMAKRKDNTINKTNPEEGSPLDQSIETTQ